MSLMAKTGDCKKILLTTPIYYPNDKPHLGHVYTSVVTDFLARFYRIHGYEVLFSTGLDEHGQKMYKTAMKKGVSPQQYIDEMVPFFKDMLSAYNISYDVFIRTTEERHKRAAKALWLEMKRNGYIVKDKYAGWYNVSDEAFVKADDVSSVTEDGVSAVAKDGRALIWLEEECYFFKLSMFRDRLIDYYQNISALERDGCDSAVKPHGWIYPRSRLNEVIGFLQQPLLDVAISRTTLDWGIDVPLSDGEEVNGKHVMYVWVDALTNYLTVIGYPDYDVVNVSSIGEVKYSVSKNACEMSNIVVDEVGCARFDKEFWENSVHILGKDILRFHAVYWPAFLMAVGIHGPAKIIAHGWWLSDKEEKMSKSLGNVVEPMKLLEMYDREQLRWFFLREMVIGQDGKFSCERVNIRWNELANNVGNLMQRSVTLLVRNFSGEVLSAEAGVIDDGEKFLSGLEKCVEDCKLEMYASMLLEYGTKLNKYFDENAPWKSVISDNAVEQRDGWQVLSNVVYGVRMIVIALEPIVPERAGKMREVVGLVTDAVVSMPGEILFKRM